MPNQDKKFNKHINMDTATPEKIAETNEELVEYMEDTGEDVAAEQIETLIDAPTKENINKTDPNSFKLLTVNKKILSTLEKIYRDMFDEQDTSIKHTRTDVVTPNVTLVSQQKEKLNAVDYSGDFEGPDFSPRGPRLNSPNQKRKKTPNQKRKKTSTDAKRTKKHKRPRKTSGLKKGGRALGKGLGRGIRTVSKVGIRALSGLAASSTVAVLGAAYAGYEIGSAIDDVYHDEIGTVAQPAIEWLNDVTGGLVTGSVSANQSAIDKYESLGIIDYDTFGNSDIVSWVKLATLAPKEIQEIINIDDWSSEDTQKLNGLKTALIQTKQINQSDEASTSYTSSERTPINYTMKAVPALPELPKDNKSGFTENKSLNPSDYKASELFNFYKVKEKDFDDLEPNTLHNMKAMAAEYLDIHGEKIQINSAFRSFKEQEKLKEKFGGKAAAPGKSMHNYGLAIDMNTVNAEKAINSGLFRKYGFTRPVPGETWHVEPVGLNRVAIRENGQNRQNDLSKTTPQTSTISPPTKEFQESEQTAQEVRKEARKEQSEQITEQTAQEVLPIQQNNSSVEKRAVENKVIPIKTSSLNKSKNISIEKPKVVNPEIDKTKRDAVIEQSSANLSTQTIEYDKRVQTEQLSAIMTPVIKQNINNTKPEQDNRIIDVFSN